MKCWNKSQEPRNRIRNREQDSEIQKRNFLHFFDHLSRSLEKTLEKKNAWITWEEISLSHISLGVIQ